MTRATERPLRRLVRTTQHGELVIELTDRYLMLREKGRRTRFTVAWGAVYVRAAQDAADERRRLRRKRRETRRSH